MGSHHPVGHVGFNQAGIRSSRDTERVIPPTCCADAPAELLARSAAGSTCRLIDPMLAMLPLRCSARRGGSRPVSKPVAPQIRRSVASTARGQVRNGRWFDAALRENNEGRAVPHALDHRLHLRAAGDMAFRDRAPLLPQAAHHRRPLGWRFHGDAGAFLGEDSAPAANAAAEFRLPAPLCFSIAGPAVTYHEFVVLA